jgi:hypothetical protein
VADDEDQVPAAPACIAGAGAGAPIADRTSPVAPAEAQERAPKHKTDRDGLQHKGSVKHLFCLPDESQRDFINYLRVR